ncbi:MAG: hypothetical protein Q9218_005606 [Villophora microphyllina]
MVKREEAEQYRREAARYPVIDSNTVVKTEDEIPLAYFIKGAMFAGLSLNEREELKESLLRTVKELIKEYPPPPPKTNDSRVKSYDKQKAKPTKNEKKCGQHNFMYLIPQGQKGHKPPDIHTHAQKKVSVVTEYMRNTTGTHNLVAKWIANIDPDTHRQLHDSYQRLGAEKLKHLYQGPNACHSSHVLVVDLAVDPHKDSNDAKQSWTVTHVVGKFTGGLVALPELGIRIKQEQGDFLIMHAAILTHFVEEIEEGERFSQVYFTRKDILFPAEEPKEKVEWPCPFPGCSKRAPKYKGIKGHLRGPTKKGPRLAAINSGKNAYHFLTVKEIKDNYEASLKPVLVGTNTVVHEPEEDEHKEDEQEEDEHDEDGRDEDENDEDGQENDEHKEDEH